MYEVHACEGVVKCMRSEEVQTGGTTQTALSQPPITRVEKREEKNEPLVVKI